MAQVILTDRNDCRLCKEQDYLFQTDKYGYNLSKMMSCNVLLLQFNVSLIQIHHYLNELNTGMGINQC